MTDSDGSEGGVDADADAGSRGNWREHEARSVRDDEPEEFDPHSLGPEIPEPPDYSEVEVEGALQVRFWSLVGVFNVALLAVSLGLMFLVFEGALELGGQLVVAGLVLSGYGYYRYRRTKRQLAADDSELTGGTDRTDGSG